MLLVVMNWFAFKTSLPILKKPSIGQNVDDGGEL